MRTIKIATDFSDTPLGRYPSDSPFNGTTFRESLLRPALDIEDKVVIDIDDVEGYGSSFLEESFGGLVREGYFVARDLRKKLEILYKDPDFRFVHDQIWKYISDAKPKSGE